VDINREILCDTNIWYGFANGRFEVPRANLTHSRTTILELIQVKPAPSNPDQPKQVCKVFLDQLSTGYHLQPIAHMAEVLGIELPNGYVSKSLLLHQQAVEVIRVIACGTLDNRDIEELETLVKSLQRPIQLLWESLSQIISDYKKEEGAQNNVDREAHLQGTKNLITKWIVEKVGKSIYPDNIDWDRIEFFLHTFDSWLKELEVTKRKPKFNDFTDAFNLAYVQPGTLYWTEDGSWKTLIRSAGVQKYLYPSYP